MRLFLDGTDRPSRALRLIEALPAGSALAAHISATAPKRRGSEPSLEDKLRGYDGISQRLDLLYTAVLVAAGADPKKATSPLDPHHKSRQGQALLVDQEPPG